MTYLDFHCGLTLGLVKLAQSGAKLLIHFASRCFMVANAGCVLQYADAGLRVLQLPYKSGDFLLLRLCHFRQRCRSRKSTAHLRGCSVQDVGVGDEHDKVT